MLSFGKISITVYKANLTHDVCTFSTMDPYFIAYMQEKKNYAYISQIKKKAGKYPLWNETLTFDNLGEKCLVFEVLHEKDLIGKAEIPLHEIVTRVSFSTQYALYKGTKITGQIFVNIMYTASISNNNQGVQLNDSSKNLTKKLTSSQIEESSESKVSSVNPVNGGNLKTSQNENLKRSSGLDTGFSPINPNQNGFIGYQSMNSSEIVTNGEIKNNLNTITPPTSQIPMNIYASNLNPIQQGQYNIPNYNNQYYGTFPPMNQQIQSQLQNQSFTKQNSYVPEGFINPMINYNQMGNYTNHNLMGPPHVNNNPYINQFNNLNQLNNQPNVNQLSNQPNINELNNQPYLNPLNNQTNLNQYSNQPYLNTTGTGQLTNPPQINEQPILNQPSNPNNNQNNSNQYTNQFSNNKFVNNEVNNQMFSSVQPEQLKSHRSSENNSLSSNDNNNLQQDSIYFKTLSYFKYPLFFQNNSKNIWSYDIINAAWKQLNNPSQEYFGKYHRATELPDGSYFLTGGEVNGQTLNIVRHFNNGYFTQKQNMIFQRKAHCVIYSAGFIFVFGGFGTSGVMKTSEKFDLIKGTWTSIANMNYPRGYGTGVVYSDNFIFLIGGFIGDKLDGVYYINVYKYFRL